MADPAVGAMRRVIDKAMLAVSLAALAQSENRPDWVWAGDTWLWVTCGLFVASVLIGLTLLALGDHPE
jgi:hypothetical protein